MAFRPDPKVAAAKGPARPSTGPGTRGPPRFVTFEGIDGAGKSTLTAGVAKALAAAGHDPVVTREETPSWLGDAVKKSIQNGADPLATCYLFLADRAHHLAELAPHFAAGRLVVCDRYHDSTRAYQSVTLADRIGGVETFERWLAAQVAPWLVVPSRTYLVDLDAEEACKRMEGRKGRTVYERAAFLGDVRDAYLRFAAKEPARWVVLDGARRPEELVSAVLDDMASAGLIPSSGSSRAV